MDGTNPLLIKQIKLINRTHVMARPLESAWPELGYIKDGVTYPLPGFPRLFMDDGCSGLDHITYNVVNDWKVHAGVLSPRELRLTRLKQHGDMAAQIKQQITGLSTGITYKITTVGRCEIMFSGPADITYSWGTNTQVIDNETVNVTFTNNTPDVIIVKLLSGDDVVESVSITDAQETEVLKNTGFNTINRHFYDIESWYTDSYDLQTVPTDTLGWLEGPFTDQIFTIFE